MKNEEIKKGREEHKKAEAGKVDRAPAKKIRSNDYWIRQLDFARKHLNIHKQNGNNRMVGFALEQIKLIQKHLKID